jgi:8-oxo-dGTP pyrophosphatase MutT (NUDIX family)
VVGRDYCPDVPAMPPEPLPSSTVILLRDEPAADGPFSVLMLERHGSITFPGVHAFPGGIVDPTDAACAGACLPATQTWAAVGEGDTADDALPYWVAAIRELFEEMGILLAARDGRVLEGPLADEVRALRVRVLAGEPFGALLAERALVPATDALHYFARWITPRANPKRFDTRFLVGRVPPGQDAVADGTESVGHEWLTPAAALRAYHDSRIQLIPPTVRTLDDLARFDSVDAVLADASRRVVRALCPEIDAGGEIPAMTYPDNTGSGLPPRRLVLRDGRWRPA